MHQYSKGPLGSGCLCSHDTAISDRPAATHHRHTPSGSKAVSKPQSPNADPACRALPLMVVGGLSEADGAALGMHQYGKHCWLSVEP